MRKILGWYVVNPAGEQIAWHKTRQGARQLAAKLSRECPTEGPFWTVAEYAEAA